MKKENISSYLDYFLFLVYLVFFTSIVFSFRAISSISIALILITGLIRKNKNGSLFFDNNALFLFFSGCTLLFIIQALALLYTDDVAEGLKLFQRSSALVFVPLALLSTRNFLTAEKHWKLVFCFAVILCIGSLYCLAVSVFKFISGAPVTILFYHDLVKPLSQHAIQFSIMVFMALVFLIDKSKEYTNYFISHLRSPLIIFLSFFLILLSSKLIISFYFLYLLYFFFHKQFYTKKALVIVTAFMVTVVLLLATANPVGNRFKAIFSGNALLFEHEKFTPGTNFNGIQFRLLQWRFTNEILTEQHAWLSGLTPGDAQFYIDKKYISTHMYTGIPGTEKHGFLGYHTHNQFLQVLIENGWPALMIFLFICYALFKMVKNSKRADLAWLVWLLLFYCFTDAPLETQYGLVIFTFFPAFLYLGEQRSSIIKTSLKSVYKWSKTNKDSTLLGTIPDKQPN
jgi:O-antigen ligase